MSKRIVFKRVGLEGFGSYIDPTEFQLNRGSINLIKGKNGAGKTTMFDCLLWVLYKVNLKGRANDKVITWDHLKPENFRGTRGIVEFSLPDEGFDYMIARHIDFKGTTKSIKGKSTLMIFKKPIEKEAFEKEDMLGDEQYKGDQQEYINRLLGLNSKTFLNSVLFGQKMKRLIEADPEEKRKLFETLFEMDFINVAKEAADLKNSEETKKVDALIAEIEKSENEITLVEGQLASNTKLISDFKQQQTEAVNKIMDELEGKNLALQSDSDYLDKLNIDQNSFDLKKLEELQADITSKELWIANARTALMDQITSVKTNLTLEFDKKEDRLKTRRNELETKNSNIIADLSAKAELITAERTKSYTLSDSLKRDMLAVLEADIKVAKENVKVLEASQDGADIVLKGANSAMADYSKSIKDCEGRIDTLKKDIEGVETKCTYCLQDLPADKIEEVKARITEKLTKEQEILQVFKDKLPSVEEYLKKSTEARDVIASQILVATKILQDKQVALTNAENSFDPNINADYSAMIKMLNDLLTEEELLNKDKISITEELDLAKKDVEQLAGMRSTIMEELNNHPELKEKEAKISENETALLSLKNDKIALEELSETAKKAALSIPVVEERIRGIKESITKLQADKLTEESKKAPVVETISFDTRLKELKDQVALDTIEREKLEAEIKRLSWWCKTGFGSSGLKSFIFNSGLMLLNKACEKYASRMGVRMEFSVDLSTTRKSFVTKCFKGMHAVDYIDLSGGQQARLSVATAFAMHDLISATSNINILILDEIFESLDPEGIEDIFDLIRVKAGDSRSVYVITHSPMIDALNTKTIEVSLDERENSVIN